MKAKEILGDPIKRGMFHLDILRWVKKNKGDSIAQELHKLYIEIERTQGLDAAMTFQVKRAKGFGLSFTQLPITPINIEEEGNNVVIKIMERDPFQETKEEYDQRKAEMERLGIKIDEE